MKKTADWKLQMGFAGWPAEARWGGKAKRNLTVSRGDVDLGVIVEHGKIIYLRVPAYSLWIMEMRVRNHGVSARNAAVILDLDARRVWIERSGKRIWERSLPEPPEEDT